MSSYRVIQTEILHPDEYGYIEPKKRVVFTGSKSACDSYVYDEEMHSHWGGPRVNLRIEPA